MWVGGSPKLLAAGKGNTQNMPHPVNFKQPASNEGMTFPGVGFGIKAGMVEATSDGLVTVNVGPFSLNSDGEADASVSFGPVGVGTGGFTQNGYTSGTSKEISEPSSFYVVSGTTLIKRVDVVDVTTTIVAANATSTNIQRFQNENYANGTSTGYVKIKDSTQINGNYSGEFGKIGGSLSLPLIYKNNMPSKPFSFIKN